MEEIFIKEEPLFFSDDPALSEKSGDGEKGGDSSPPVGADLIKKEEPQESCVGEWVPIPSSLPTHDEKFSIKEEPEIKDDELDLHSEPLTPESSSFKADQVEDVSSTEKSSGKESEATYFGSSYLTCPTSQSKSLSNVGSPKADGKRDNTEESSTADQQDSSESTDHNEAQSTSSNNNSSRPPKPAKAKRKDETITNELLESVRDHFKRPRPLTEDRCDIFGKNVAMKLRAVDAKQMFIAEKLINDLLFEAEMGHLTPEHAYINMRDILRQNQRSYFPAQKS